MSMKTMPSFRLAAGMAAVGALALAAPPSEAQQALPAAELLQHVDLSGFGTADEWFRVHVKFGDLDNDGQPRDFIRYVNSNRMQAFRYDGAGAVELLWDYEAPIDLPDPVVRWMYQYALWDIDQDGETEVIGPFATERGFVELRVLDGATGAVEASRLLPILNPTLDHQSRGQTLKALIANVRGLDTPQDIVVLEERASNGDIWVLTDTLDLLWDTTGDAADKRRITASNVFAYDVDADGRDELVGSWLLDDDGTRLDRLTPAQWAAEDMYYDHIRRAVAADFLPDSPGTEILYSHAYNEATLFDLTGGTVVWRRDTLAQSPGIRVVGEFTADNPGLEFVFYEPDGGVSQLSNMAGEVLAELGSLRNAYTIDWDGDRTTDEVFACRDAVLVDPGSGATLELRALYEAQANDLIADDARLYGVAFDIIGDAREEIVIADETELLIFGAVGAAPADLASPWQDPRYRLAMANAVTDFFCDRSPWFDWRTIGQVQ